MERRKAFATAGAVSVTALAATMALGANLGLFGLARSDAGPGQFRLVDNTQYGKPTIRTEIVDVPVPVADPAPPAAVGGRSAPSQSTQPASGSSVAPGGSTGGGSTYESGDDGHEVEDGHELEPGDDEDD